jgi:hypothetical protein
VSTRRCREIIELQIEALSRAASAWHDEARGTLLDRRLGLAGATNVAGEFIARLGGLRAADSVRSRSTASAVLAPAALMAAVRTAARSRACSARNAATLVSILRA